METTTKRNLLIGIIILLLVINISALVSLFYHSRVNIKKQTDIYKIEQETRMRGMHQFIRDELNLTDEQFSQFQEINSKNMQESHKIAIDLNELRIEMMNELAKKNPNQNKLDFIASEIGNLHYELKKLTIKHFLELKEVCNKEQQDKLLNIFMKVINDDRPNRHPMNNNYKDRQHNRHGKR